MPFNIIGFLAGRAIAENAGVDRQRATQLAIVPSALNLPLPVSLITTRAIAQRETPAAIAPGTTTPTPDGQVIVPNLIGQPVENAKKLAAEMGLTQVETFDVASGTGDIGKVVGQSYAANSTIAKDDPLILFVGQGLPPIAVPELVGLSFAVATEILDDAELNYKVVGTASNNLPKDYVIDQEPDPNQPAPADTTVSLTLSLGPAGDAVKDKIEVPNVISMHVDKAKETLKKKGFSSEITNERKDNLPAGHIFSQQPDPFALVEPGTAIQLGLSQGPDGGVE